MLHPDFNLKSPAGVCAKPLPRRSSLQAKTPFLSLPALLVLAGLPLSQTNTGRILGDQSGAAQQRSAPNTQVPSV